jgi:hypothetical protein
VHRGHDDEEVEDVRAAGPEEVLHRPRHRPLGVLGVLHGGEEHALGGERLERRGRALGARARGRRDPDEGRALVRRRGGHRGLRGGKCRAARGGKGNVVAFGNPATWGPRFFRGIDDAVELVSSFPLMRFNNVTLVGAFAFPRLPRHPAPHRTHHA